MDVQEARTECDRVLDAIEQAVIGDRAIFETILLGVLSRGHVLLEDVPGTGKTLTAQSLASALGLSFSRIQFTPDLLPADVTGSHIFNEQTGEFEFTEGSIFANVVLADEINRAPPKTQAALLEAMEENQVSVDGNTRELPTPFFVIATQNPVEEEGTFPLPEAQMDRFLVKTSLGYPDEQGLTELLSRRAGRVEQTKSIDVVLNHEQVSELRNAPENVTVDDDVITYIAKVGLATHDHPDVAVGVSPRGVQRLFEAGRAHAVIKGREFVTPDDIRVIADPVLTHRLVLTTEATVGNVKKQDIIDQVVSSVPVPTID